MRRQHIKKKLDSLIFQTRIWLDSEWVGRRKRGKERKRLWAERRTACAFWLRFRHPRVCWHFYWTSSSCGTSTLPSWGLGDLSLSLTHTNSFSFSLSLSISLRLFSFCNIMCDFGKFLEIFWYFSLPSKQSPLSVLLPNLPLLGPGGVSADVPKRRWREEGSERGRDWEWTRTRKSWNGEEKRKRRISEEFGACECPLWLPPHGIARVSLPLPLPSQRTLHPWILSLSLSLLPCHLPWVTHRAVLPLLSNPPPLSREGHYRSAFSLRQMFGHFCMRPSIARPLRLRLRTALLLSLSPGPLHARTSLFTCGFFCSSHTTLPSIAFSLSIHWQGLHIPLFAVYVANIPKARPLTRQSLLFLLSYFFSLFSFPFLFLNAHFIHSLIYDSHTLLQGKISFWDTLSHSQSRGFILLLQTWVRANFLSTLFTSLGYPITNI